MARTQVEQKGFIGALRGGFELGGLSIADLMDVGEEVPVHSHESAHVAFVIHGEYETCAAGFDGVCPGGTLIYNPPNTTHRDHFAAAGGRFLAISLSNSFFASAAEVGILPGHPVGLPEHELGFLGTQLNIFLDHRITTVVLSNLTEVDVVDVSNRIANVALGLSADLPHPNRKREVLRALMESDPRKAISALGALEARDRPTFGELFRLGFGFFENGEGEKARKIAEFMTGVYPKSEWPWVLLGRIDAEHDPEQAELAFRKALEKNPGSLPAAQGSRALGKE